VTATAARSPVANNGSASAPANEARVSTVNSWYQSASGRVAQHWPFPLLDCWKRTRDVDLDDDELA
jgi:hypothetical protein